MAVLMLDTGSLRHLEMSSAEAEAAVTHFLAEVAQFAPCLLGDSLTPEQAAYAEAVIVGAIERRHDMRRDRVTQTAGRQSVTYAPTVAPAYVSARFTEAEKADLAALCGGTVAPGGTVPLGRFPKPPRWPW